VFVSEFEHVYQTLTSQGFTVVDEPTESFEGVGKTVELHHDKRGFRIDIFEQQIVGKVWITDRMRDRAEEFWTGSFVTAFILSDEDMFLLKAVSGGDLASGRRRDIEDMRKYAQRGLDYELILTGSTNSDRSIPARLKHGRFVIVRIPIHYRDGSKLTVGAPKQVHRSYRRVRDGRSRSNIPFWVLLTMGSTTSKYFEIEFSRMCEHFRTTRKTPSMKRLID